jgi:ethanolamine utilization cobalamin adenosyltransferase
MRGENMGKKLITPKNLDEYVLEGQKELIIDRNTIISPGAKDLLDDKNILTIYGEDIPKKDLGSKDLIEDGIRKILREEYKIENNEDMKILIKKIWEKSKYHLK